MEGTWPRPPTPPPALGTATAAPAAFTARTGAAVGGRRDPPTPPRHPFPAAPVAGAVAAADPHPHGPSPPCLRQGTAGSRRPGVASQHPRTERTRCHHPTPPPSPQKPPSRPLSPPPAPPHSSHAPPLDLQPRHGRRGDRGPHPKRRRAGGGRRGGGETAHGGGDGGGWGCVCGGGERCLGGLGKRGGGGNCLPGWWRLVARSHRGTPPVNAACRWRVVLGSLRRETGSGSTPSKAGSGRCR